jgi:hypothetical protein
MSWSHGSAPEAEQCLFWQVGVKRKDCNDCTMASATAPASAIVFGERSTIGLVLTARFLAEGEHTADSEAASK